jgi:xylitol oxidase
MTGFNRNKSCEILSSCPKIFFITMSTLQSSQSSQSSQTNWAGNIAYSAAEIYRPETLEQVRAIVSRSKKMRVLGSRHSFNAIADSTGDLIALDKMPQTAVVAPDHRTVTVSAGMTYGELGLRLGKEGLALHNTASLPHISVAGAIATATHGSGDRNGNLATAVAGLEIVTAEGDVVTLSRERDGEKFLGAVVGLGGLGVVTRITLDVQPEFWVQQEVYDNLPMAQLEAHFDEIMSSAYSVSLFTDWGHEVSEVWLKRRLPHRAGLPVAPALFGATLAPAERHPVVRLSAEACTEQMGVPGIWHERLPHFRVDHIPASGDEVQTEYFVPRRHALAAMRALRAIHAEMKDVMWISELRTIAADVLWMSMCYGEDHIGLHFSWHRDLPAVYKLLPLMEAQLAPFDVRPHWGKLFAMPPQRVQACYPKLDDFRALLKEFDPAGKFRNAFLETGVFGFEAR